MGRGAKSTVAPGSTSDISALTATVALDTGVAVLPATLVTPWRLTGPMPVLDPTL